MKPFGIVVAVVAVGALLFWLLGGREERGDQPQAPPPVEVQETEEDPVAMALPPELDDMEIDEVVSEEEVKDIKPLHKGKLTKPKILGKTKLADGRIEVRILSPVYYGDGRQRNLIRVLRASPRQMKRDAILMRAPRGMGGGGVPPGKQPPTEGEGADGGGLKKKQ